MLKVFIMPKLLSFFLLVVSVYLYNFFSAPILTEVEKCPYCFGKNLCHKMRTVFLSKSSILDLFHNYISVKNVFYGFDSETRVVLKKLGHNYEWEEVDKLVCQRNNVSDCNISAIKDTQNYYSEIIEFITKSDVNSVKNFKVCSERAAELFLKIVMNFNEGLDKDEYLKNVWTTLQLNVEPLLLQIFNKSARQWPVPKYYGACGRIIVESYAGAMLNDFANLEWTQRAHLAVQLLEGAAKFTEGDEHFRYYLTDISPDNIVVNSFLNLTFVDLENIVMVSKETNESNIHQSEVLDDESVFAYSEQQLCESSVSDHNFYAVCKLILSSNAPFPMMEGGLLHSTPEDIKSKYYSLFKNIELCARSSLTVDRFVLSDKIISDLKSVKSVL